MTKRVAYKAKYLAEKEKVQALGRFKVGFENFVASAALDHKSKALLEELKHLPEGGEHTLISVTKLDGFLFFKLTAGNEAALDFFDPSGFLRLQFKDHQILVRP